MSNAPVSIYEGHGLRGIPHRLRIQRILKTVRNFDLRGKSYADVGCDDGFVTAKIVEQIQPSKTVGYDSDPPLLTQIEKLHPSIQYHQIDINVPLVQEEQYDLVTCFETLEHVVRLDHAVRNLLSLVAPRGVLIITVPVEIGPVGLVKFLAKTLVWRDDLAKTFPNSRGINLHYFLKLLSGQDISQFRVPSPETASWPSHFGFNYLRIDQILVEEKVTFSAVNRAGSRMYVIQR